MSPRTQQWTGLIVGLGLIAIYSGIMIASDGAGGWAALLLVAGIAVIVATAIRASRGGSDR
jgi:hypothetical protein